jgi:hypothetical protein
MTNPKRGFQDRLKVRSTKQGTQYVRLSDILMNREITQELRAMQDKSDRKESLGTPPRPHNLQIKAYRQITKEINMKTIEERKGKAAIYFFSLRQHLRVIVANAKMILDPSMGGATDTYSVPLDDITDAGELLEQIDREFGDV